ncbi:UNVERIFIED_CONTAM: hypothetical protein HDU68_009972, partial [Siphonaria sp. JEL0065]
MLNPGPLNPETLVTSVHVSSVTLFWIRLVFLIYFIACLVGELIYAAPKAWGYFTEWTWLGITIYLSVAVYNGHLYNTNKDAVAIMARRPYWKQYTNWLLYVLPATYVYIVSLIFWALLSGWIIKAVPLNKWLLVSQHSVNSIVMVMEFVLGRVQLSYRFLLPYTVIAILYLGLAFVYHNVEGVWVYSFLDTTKSGAWMWYTGVLLLFIIEFLIVVAIHNGRDRRRIRLGLKVVGGYNDANHV